MLMMMGSVGRLHFFYDVHNHEMYQAMHSGKLPAHRQLTTNGIMQVNNMRKVGISTLDIYNSFANQSGGYA
jgi:hypothetical protein